jgi:hypothetical protein
LRISGSAKRMKVATRCCGSVTSSNRNGDPYVLSKGWLISRRRLDSLKDPPKDREH